ncbi:hypothetical protein BBW65_03855 [Helicobacter enhydrae]|uniref:NAD kinase n=1 Tax=Helicobacter enhydrae TaxID=222136 RepID=A0A1B1U5L8_9HELI|nr:NAD(+)/NADH kinase [Helicobacter enhydrae]ANV97985.1 hypothetical protein BBW65_03855 [Helicobacter enhydrae]
MLTQKCIGIFLRPNVAQAKLTECLEVLEEFGFEVLCKGLDFTEQDIKRMEQECDFLISLGGDGTLIATMHQTHALPILGVNAGWLGFLTIPLSAFRAFIQDLCEGQYTLERYKMLSVWLDEQKICNAINEVLISKKDLPTMVQIDAKIDAKIFNHYRCDGLIVATPLGSTAYNISAGGSVVHPKCKSILLTPLAPHSLTQRPMILDEEVVLEFGVLADSQIIIDGQKAFDLKPDQCLRICCEGDCMSLLYPKNHDYFEVLREKFHWGV